MAQKAAVVRELQQSMSALLCEDIAALAHAATAALGHMPCAAAYLLAVVEAHDHVMPEVKYGAGRHCTEG